MRLLLVWFLLLATLVSSRAYTYSPTNSVFAYYGLPTTNANGIVYAAGISSAPELTKTPPVQVRFNLTGTNFSFTYTPLNPWGSGLAAYWELRDNGVLLGSYTNQYGLPYNDGLTTNTVSFASGGIHQLSLSIKGGFVGLNLLSGNTIAATTLPKPNLLIVEGDSYTEGYNPTVLIAGFQSSWFDGWVWQLANLVPNTIPAPTGISGTGFVSDNGTPSSTPKYGSRVLADVVALYSNSVSSGKYGEIFICASGTINDLGSATNTVYIGVTNVYSLILSNCPLAHVFSVGNWLGVGGRLTPQSDDIDHDTVTEAASTNLALPYFSPIKSAIRNAGNYDTFFPPGNTDSVHPGAAGYAIMAGWVNINLTATFGAVWSGGGSSLSLNVTNYGAKGDYTNLTVSCTNGSYAMLASHALVSSDTNKLILIREGGPYGTAGLHQDLLARIVSVSGANFTTDRKAGASLINTPASYGTENSAFFKAAVDDIPLTGLTTLIIPDGNYWLLNTNYDLATNFSAGQFESHPAVTLSKGGILFQGGLSSTLTGNGAWVNHGSYVYRGAMFFCTSPVTNSASPLIFSNIRFDGAIPQVIYGYNSSTDNGGGWDYTHHAVCDDNPTVSAMHQLKVFTNCTFMRWAGENLISFDAGTNGGNNNQINLMNCVFQDSPATADNMYYGQLVSGCLFSNVLKVTEFSQYNSALPTLFRDCVWTNLTGIPITVLGAQVGYVSPSFTVSNCVGAYSLSCFHLPNAQNVNLISNKLFGSDSFLVLGGAGAQAAGVVTNTRFVTIYGNVVNGSSGNPYIIAYSGSSDIFITNNAFPSGNTFIQGYGPLYASNVVLSANSGGPVDSAAVSSGQYFIDLANNSFAAYGAEYDYSGVTNTMTYSRGRYHNPFVTQPTSGYVLVTNNLVPSGASMTIYNTGANPVKLFSGSTSTLLTNLPTSSTVYFSWSGYSWTNDFSLGLPALPRKLYLRFKH